jgi:Xaa-Pro dipeptidase
VLHWQHQDKRAPQRPSTLLIDAGASHRGYAADITRTWLHPQAPASGFADLLLGMERLQLALVDEVRAGTDYAAVHLSAHRRIAQLLLDTGLLQGLSAEAAVAQGLSSTFFPHGIGHLLGLQVHDVAGLQADRAGMRRERPEGHPYLRLTRTLEPGMVVTIEPGLYFIPMLLRERRASATAGHLNWKAVEALLPFGGIRIEDDVACRAEGPPENLTRDAFAVYG